MLSFKDKKLNFLENDLTKIIVKMIDDKVGGI